MTRHLDPRRVWRLVLGALVAAMFLWLLLRHVTMEDIVNAMRGADALRIAAAVAVFAVGYACRIERWRLMLRHENGGLSWSDCAGPLVASIAANNVLPLRAGDLLRVLSFNRTLGVSTATSVATLVVERLLDLLMIIAFFGIALAVFGARHLDLLGLGGYALAGIAAGICGALLFPRVLAPWVRAFGRRVASAWPRVGGRLSEALGRAMDSLEVIASGRTMPLLMLWSLLAWCAEGSVFWLAATAMPSLAVPQGSWLAFPIGTLATVIPSTPGYVGTFDYFVVQPMSVLGNAHDAATAYALLVHLLIWLPPTAVGGLYFLTRALARDKTNSALPS
jgi:uncharacterized protein (TIRG00374 family)